MRQFSLQYGDANAGNSQLTAALRHIDNLSIRSKCCLHQLISAHIMPHMYVNNYLLSVQQLQFRLCSMHFKKISHGFKTSRVVAVLREF